MERLNPLQPFLFVAAILVRTSTSFSCKANWTENNGFCYRVFNEYNLATLLYWNEADTACKNEQADLVSVHSEMENQFVKRLAGVKALFWIGLNDIQHEGTYRWSDGTAMDYTNWSEGHPHNTSHPADCVFSTSSGWSIQECTFTGTGYALSYVCKYSLNSEKEGETANLLNGEMRGALFSRIPNKALIRLAILRKDGCTFLGCARLCLATTGCKSYNFKPELGQCEINSATAQEFPHLLVTKGDSIYAVLLPSGQIQN